MPLFEYKCADCGAVTEILRSAAPQESPECPQCGVAMEKALSTFSARSNSAPVCSSATTGCQPDSCGCPCSLRG